MPNEPQTGLIIALFQPEPVFSIRPLFPDWFALKSGSDGKKCLRATFLHHAIFAGTEVMGNAHTSYLIIGGMAGFGIALTVLLAFATKLK